MHGKQKVEGSNPSLSSRRQIKYMSQDNLIKFQCAKCNRINYWSRKNKKKIQHKLELKKFCKWCKKHTPHKEVKK